MLCRVCQTMQKHMVALILSCSLEIICEIIICNSKEFIIKARTAWDIAHELHEIKNKSWLRTVAVGNNLMEGKALDWVSGEGRAWPGAEGRSWGCGGTTAGSRCGESEMQCRWPCRPCGTHLPRAVLLSWSSVPFGSSGSPCARTPQSPPPASYPCIPFTLFSLLYLGLSPSFDCFHR